MVTVALVGSGQGGRDAIGARVDVITDRGRFTRWRSGGGSYLSAHAPSLLFGLGESLRIDHVEVTWPDGSRERFEAKLDSAMSARRGEGTATSD